MCKIIIEGQVPSLKNAKKISINPKTGQRFVRTETRVKEYMDEAKESVRQQWRGVPLEEVEHITCVIYNKDKRKHDLGNEWDTLADILSGIVYTDDNQFCVGSVQLTYGGVDKARPRAELWIDF